MVDEEKLKKIEGIKQEHIDALRGLTPQEVVGLHNQWHDKDKGITRLEKHLLKEKIKTERIRNKAIKKLANIYMKELKEIEAKKKKEIEEERVGETREERMIRGGLKTQEGKPKGFRGWAAADAKKDIYPKVREPVARGARYVGSGAEKAGSWIKRQAQRDIGEAAKAAAKKIVPEKVRRGIGTGVGAVKKGVGKGVEKVKTGGAAVGRFTDTYTPTLKKGVVGAGRLGWGVARGGATFGTNVLTGGWTKTHESLKNKGLMIIIFPIILYALDFFFGYNGISISPILTKDWGAWLKFLAELVTTGTFILLMVLYFTFKGWPKDKREFVYYILLIIVVLIILNLGGWNLWTLYHLAFAFGFVYIYLMKGLDRENEGITTTHLLFLLILVADFFLFTALAEWNLLVFNNETYKILSNRILLPLWFFFTIGFVKDSGMKKFIIFLITAFYVFLFGLQMWTAYQGTLTELPADYKQDIINAPKVAIDNFVKAVKASFSRQLEYATGGYYNGMVEENEDEPLGVYLEDIEAADKEFFEDEPIIIWANLKAKTLDKEDTVNILLNCSAYEDEVLEEEKRVKVIGEVSPDIDYPEDNEENNVHLKVETLEEEDIKCEFEKNSLKNGRHEVKLFAKFDFKTMAYLKSYFMDEETMRSMRREGIDVLDFYKIKDKKPIARFTNGPVKVGIEAKEPPIGVSEEYDVKPMIGITVHNQWTGKIKRIEDLILYIPDNMGLDLNSCDYDAFEEYKDISDTKVEEGYRAYRLKSSVKTIAQMRDIDKYRSFKCRLDIKKENAKDVLGNLPLAIKYFRATVKYTYELEKSTNLNIKEADWFNVHLSPSKPKSNDTLECIGKHPKNDIISAKYEFYRNDVLSRSGPVVDCSAKECKVEYPDKMVRGETIKCVITAKIKDIGEGSDSETVNILNTPPTIKIENPESHPADQNLDCRGVAYDHDGEVVRAEFQFTGGHFDDGEISCPSNICEATVLSKELSVGETIKCTMVPFDSEGERGDAASKLIKIRSAGTAAPTGDTINPAKIRYPDITGSWSTEENKIILQFTAPGDDGTTGIVNGYKLKIHDKILGNQEWDKGRDPPGLTYMDPPGEAGTYERIEISGNLSSIRGTTIYIAVRAYDEAGNMGDTSDNVQITIPKEEPKAET